MMVLSRTWSMAVVLSLFVFAGAPIWVWAQQHAPNASWAIRVGEHPTYTRVVFDLPTATPYLISQGQDAMTILVEFLQGPLLSGEKIVPISRGVVRNVSVVPSPTQTTAEIRLLGPAQVRSYFTLPNPPRLVVDFRIGKNH